MRRTLRRSLGMARVLAHLAKGAATMALVFPFIGATRRRRIIQRWSERVLEIFGLKLQVAGQPATIPGQRPVMLVGNHISWIDIYAYLCVADVRFVAKSEVKRWPLIGWFARHLGTIFVERDRPRDALGVGPEVRRALEERQSVSVFPEGTTTDGSIVLPFSSVLMSAAVDVGVAVQPVSIAYRRPDGGMCRRTAFLGSETLVASIWELAGGGTTHVMLTFLEPVATHGADRRQLARRCEDAVRRSLGHPPRVAPPPLAPGAASAEGAATASPSQTTRTALAKPTESE